MAGVSFDEFFKVAVGCIAIAFGVILLIGLAKLVLF